MRARTLHRWGGFRIVEHADPGHGIGADHATEMSAFALLASRRFLRGKRVCEVGCGTGALCVLAAKLGASEVLGIEVDARALELSRRTAAANGVEAAFRKGDLLRGVRGRFDVLIANLPQKPVPAGMRLPSAHDGGLGGLSLLRRFLRQASRRLASGGRLYLFLHSLAAPEPGAILQGWRWRTACRRRRHVARGEFPPPLVAHWLGRHGSGLRLRKGGGRTFEARLVVAHLKREG